MKKATLLALSLIVPFSFLAPAEAAGKEAAPATTAAKLDLAKLFDGKLVSADGKRANTDSIKKAKYVAVYYSAHWCAPCKAFTPDLVRFVNENRKDDNFEVVLLSSDYSDKNMLAYMTETKMPWAGTLGKTSPGKDGIIKEFNEINKGLVGIPHLRVYDAEGNMVIDTIKDGKYVGPRYVLDELKKKI